MNNELLDQVDKKEIIRCQEKPLTSPTYMKGASCAQNRYFDYALKVNNKQY